MIFFLAINGDSNPWRDRIPVDVKKIVDTVDLYEYICVEKNRIRKD